LGFHFERGDAAREIGDLSCNVHANAPGYDAFTLRRRNWQINVAWLRSGVSTL
jgi:hypothetical protein